MSNLSTFSIQPGYVYRDVAIILVGTSVHWLLYGVLLVQTYFYYTAFLNGHRLLKHVVLLLLFLETIQAVLFTHDVFRVFARGFDNILLANEVDTVWVSVPLMTGLIALLTQVFYCYRIAVFTKSKCAVAVIIMLSMIELGSAIATAMQTRAARFLPDILKTRISLITIGIWGASGAGCDTMIAIIMVYYLRTRDSGFQGTHNIVKRLIRLTIETGFITASCAIISTALSYIPGDPPYYQATIVILAKTYSNSMMAALNSRIKIVSKAPSGFPPSWNESARPIEPTQGRVTQDIAFIRDESICTMGDAV